MDIKYLSSIGLNCVPSQGKQVEQRQLQSIAGLPTSSQCWRNGKRDRQEDECPKATASMPSKDVRRIDIRHSRGCEHVGSKLLAKDVTTTTVGHFTDSDRGLSFEVCLRPDRNSKMQCIDLLFVRSQKTIGYILIEVLESSFVLRGMHVSEHLRGEGLATTFMAIWLFVCFEFSVVPETTIMDKPIITVLLQKYGFRPSKLSQEVEVGRAGEDGLVALWAEDLHQLRSHFSKRWLKSQHMAIVADRPSESTTTYVNTTYELPKLQADVLKDQVTVMLQGKLSLRPEGVGHFFRRPPPAEPRLSPRGFAETVKRHKETITRASGFPDSLSSSANRRSSPARKTMTLESFLAPVAEESPQDAEVPRRHAKSAAVFKNVVFDTASGSDSCESYVDCCSLSDSSTRCPWPGVCVCLPPEAIEIHFSVTYFGVEVVRPKGGSTYRLKRRYNDFKALAEQLGGDSKSFVNAPFPRKTFRKVVGERLEARRASLELWLSTIVQHPLSNSDWHGPLAEFLEGL